MSRKQIDRNLVDRLDKEGLTSSEIASRMGCDRSSVRKILTRELDRPLNCEKSATKMTDAQLKAAAEAGLIVNEIAEKYSITKGQIQRRAIRVLGHKLPHAKARHFQYDREEIKRLLDEQYSPEGIVEIMGMNPETLFRVMRDEFGIYRTDTTPVSNEEHREMERLLDDGWSYKQIGRKLGRADKTVAKHLPGRGWSVEEANEYRRMFRILDSL